MPPAAVANGCVQGQRDSGMQDYHAAFLMASGCGFANSISVWCNADFFSELQNFSELLLKFGQQALARACTMSTSRGSPPGSLLTLPGSTSVAAWPEAAVG